MGKPEELPDCNCYAYSDFEIGYCPLHEAAPDLLEACKTALETFDQLSDQHDLAVDDFELKQVIAKAEGKLG